MTTTDRYNSTHTAHSNYARCIMHCALALLLLSSCSNDKDPGGNDEFEEGVPTEVSFSISSRFNGSDSSRADGAPVDPEDPNEKINDWFMVFADMNNKVQKVITRTGAGINTINNPVEEETFRFILPSGHYNVYAFANMSVQELEGATELSFSEGSTIEPSAIDGKTWNTQLNNWDITEKPIPMTGFLKNIEVKNTIEETFSIEVVRMVAKIEFRFFNIGNSAVSINGVSLDPVTTSSVSLFPRNSSGIGYTHLGESAYSALSGASYGTVSQNFTSPVVVAANTEDEDTEESAIPRASLYIKESLSNRANGNAFTVGIKVTHKNGISEHQQYNITKDIKNYINRNDWIVIPIKFSQYDVSVEALFYPPIGGYPAVLSSTDPDGSQVFTFGTEGEFAIVPKVIDKLTGKHLAPDEYSIVYNPGTVSDEDGIFATTPTTVTSTSAWLPDEIIGTLSTSKGKATVEVSVEIGSLIYSRKIYIIRE